MNIFHSVEKTIGIKVKIVTLKMHSFQRCGMTADPTSVHSLEQDVILATIVRSGALVYSIGIFIKNQA